MFNRDLIISCSSSASVGSALLPNLGMQELGGEDGGQDPAENAWLAYLSTCLQALFSIWCLQKDAVAL